MKHDIKRWIIIAFALALVIGLTTLTVDYRLKASEDDGTTTASEQQEAAVRESEPVEIIVPAREEPSPAEEPSSESEPEVSEEPEVKEEVNETEDSDAEESDADEEENDRPSNTKPKEREQEFISEDEPFEDFDIVEEPSEDDQEEELPEKPEEQNDEDSEESADEGESADEETTGGTDEKADKEPAEPVEEKAAVKVRILNKGDLYYGDTIKLQAMVKNVADGYTLQWQQNNGNGWEDIPDATESVYEFIITEESATDYRVIVHENEG